MSSQAEKITPEALTDALPPGAAPHAGGKPVSDLPPPELTTGKYALPPAQMQLFNKVYRKLKEAQTFAEILPEIEPDILHFFQARRLTVYQTARNGKEIIAKFKSGAELHEIRLPLSPASVAGYVALSHKPVTISDAHDPNELSAIHASLKFDKRFDKRSGFITKAMVVVPIKVSGILLGVFQIISKNDGGEFSDLDRHYAELLAAGMGEKFQEEFKVTNGPYDYLVKRGFVSEDKLSEFVKRSKKEVITMVQLLVTELKIPPELIGVSLESYFQVPFVRYDPAVEPPKKLMKKLNMSYLRRQRWLPIAGNLDEVVILIDDPSDVGRQMEIQRALQAKKYIFRVGFQEDILRYLGGGDVSTYLHDLVGKMEDEEQVEGGDIDEGAEAGEVNENEGTVIQLVNRLIIDAYRAGASDIHIEPGKGKLSAMVRMRIDGACRSSLEIPASHIRAVISRIKIMARMDIAEHRKPQDGKIVVRVRGMPLELRVATLPTVNGESAVLRVLASGGPLPFDKLNLNDRNLTETLNLLQHPHGILLVVGPTGSGKTTTLHALIAKINTPERKIWTAEDPVEITQPGLQQVQVDHKIGMNFANVLRSFLRADPDVILIGEMRDQETAHAGIEASLTGHLVFSTLHTNSAPETITRLLDLGLDPINFSDALLGVLAQRLMRTLCGDCKQHYAPQKDELAKIIHMYGEEAFATLGMAEKDIKLCRAVGCGKCGKTGYKGRTGIHELLVATDEMRKMVARSSPADALRDLAVSQGMQTLMQDGILKVIRGQTDMAQLLKVTAG